MPQSQTTDQLTTTQGKANNIYRYMTSRRQENSSFNALHTDQQLFIRVGTGLPGLNQYYTEDKLSYLRTQCW